MTRIKTLLAVAVLATGLSASTPAQAQTAHTLSPQQRYTIKVPAARVHVGGPYPVTKGLARGARLFLGSVVFPARPEAFMYFVWDGIPSIGATHALNAQMYGTQSRGITPSLRSRSTRRESVMHKDGTWSVVAQNVTQGCIGSARGGYVGHAFIEVIGLLLPGRRADQTCAWTTATRDRIYTLLAARARG